MPSTRAVIFALFIALAAPLAAGCSRAPEKSVEELESEEDRKARRAKHEKMVPKGD
jgi:hypothetical protein